MRACIDSLLSIMPEDLQTLLTSEELTSEDLLARVLHRDGLMLVLNKPAGIPVHRGPKGGDNLEAHFDVLRFGLPKPPALAHRLDKDTSGCLVLGRHHKATQALGKLFKDGLVSKTYWATAVWRAMASWSTRLLPAVLMAWARPRLLKAGMVRVAMMAMITITKRSSTREKARFFMG